VVEAVAVGQDLVAEASDDLGDRPAVGRERLIEAGSQLNAGVRRRYAAVPVACGGQVLYGKGRECMGDIGTAVGVERGEDIGRHDAIK
jgi:hypothetical protein